MATTRRAWPLLVVLCGCACSPPLIVRRSDAALAPPTPAACHLVLWWRDMARAAEPPPPRDAADSVARILREDRSRTICPEIKTWQIVRDPNKLALMAQIWRADLPVLWAALEHTRTGEEKKKRLHLRFRTRLQTGPFDTSEEPVPGNFETMPADYEADVRRALTGLKLEPRPRALSIRRADGPHAAEGFAAAERGDWPAAAGLWADAARSRPDSLEALENASVAAELAGDLKGAREWHGRLLDAAQGLGGIFRLALLTGGGDGSDREANLNGLLALAQPPIARLAPDASLAVLPLDNETPDLEADGRVRRALVRSLADAGYSPLETSTVDERLKGEGITMAGHLKALTWDRIGKRVKAEFLVAGSVEEYRALPVRQVRVRLSLIHAPTRQEVLADTVEYAELGSDSANAAQYLVKVVAARITRTELSEETKAAVERFVEPWPHFAR